MAYGSGKEPTTKILPACAALIENISKNINGERIDGNIVLINNKQWMSCISNEKVENWTNYLHEDYIESDSYKALFFGSLIESGSDTIDILVTGLPVNHCTEKKKRALENKLKGIHKVNEKNTINIKKVIVIEQPIGSYMDSIWNNNGDLL